MDPMVFFTVQVSVNGNGNNMALSGLATASCIFLFVLGVADCREKLRLMNQFGLSRSTSYQAELLALAVLAVAVAAVLEAVTGLFQFFAGDHFWFYAGDLYQLIYLWGDKTLILTFGQHEGDILCPGADLVEGGGHTDGVEEQAQTPDALLGRGLGVGKVQLAVKHADGELGEPRHIVPHAISAWDLKRHVVRGGGGGVGHCIGTCMMAGMADVGPLCHHSSVHGEDGGVVVLFPLAGAPENLHDNQGKHHHKHGRQVREGCNMAKNKAMNLVIPILSIVLAFIIGMLIILSLGANPLQAMNVEKVVKAPRKPSPRSR